MFRSFMCLALMTFTTAGTGAQGTFEGALSMTVRDDDGKATPVNYLIKGGKIRFQMAGEGAQGGLVLDPAGQKMLIIIDEMKMYMEMALPQPPTGREGRGSGRSGAARGRTETIAGYQCTHVTTTDDDGATVDSCVTSELGTFRMFLAGDGMQPPQEAGWSQGLGGSFPLKAQKGDQVLLEVTKIERKTLEASLFTAPAGYRKFAMPGRGPGPA
jgi:hypothetical protein